MNPHTQYAHLSVAMCMLILHTTCLAFQGTLFVSHLHFICLLIAHYFPIWILPITFYIFLINIKETCNINDCYPDRPRRQTSRHVCEIVSWLIDWGRKNHTINVGGIIMCVGVWEEKEETSQTATFISLTSRLDAKWPTVSCSRVQDYTQNLNQNKLYFFNCFCWILCCSNAKSN